MTDLKSLSKGPGTDNSIRVEFAVKVNDKSDIALIDDALKSKVREF